MIERVNVYVAALCGPQFVGGHGSWAWSAYAEEWSNEKKIYLPSRRIHSKQTYLPPKTDQMNAIVSFKAIIDAMEWLIEEGKRSKAQVRFYGNEIISIATLTKRWKPKGDLVTLFKKADYNRFQFSDIAFTWVGDEQLGEVLTVAQVILLDQGVDPAQFSRNTPEASPQP